MVYVVQGSSSPMSGIEPYRAIHRGDGHTTFNLPDFRDRMAIGVDKFGERVLMAERRGREDGIAHLNLSIDHLPTHTHSHGSLATSISGNYAHSIHNLEHNHEGTTKNDDFLSNNGKSNFALDAFIGIGTHRHTIRTDTTSISINSAGDHYHSINGETDTVAYGVAFSLMQPFQTINYIIYPL